MKVLFTLGIFLLVLISCSRNHEEKHGEIKIILFQTLENTQTFPLMEKLNIYLANKNHHESNQDTINTKLNDTTLSLAERLKENRIEKNKYELYRLENPLFSLLSPNISIGNNENWKLNNSPYLGTANVSDTSKITALFRDDSVMMIFPPSLRFFWNDSQMGFQYLCLAAITDNCKQISADIKNVEYLGIKKNSSFNIFDGIISDPGYQLVIKLKNDWAGKVGRLSNNKNALLLSVVLDNIQYTSPISQETAMKPILLTRALPEEAYEKLKNIYGDFVKVID